MFLSMKVQHFLFFLTLEFLSAKLIVVQLLGKKKIKVLKEIDKQ